MQVDATGRNSGCPQGDRITRLVKLCSTINSFDSAGYFCRKIAIASAICGAATDEPVFEVSSDVEAEETCKVKIKTQLRLGFASPPSGTRSETSELPLARSGTRSNRCLRAIKGD